MSLYGFNWLLTFKNSRLGRAKKASDAELGIVPRSKADLDGYIYIKCGKCNDFMDYTGDAWVCPQCNEKVSEASVYNEFDRECREFLERHPDFI